MPIKFRIWSKLLRIWVTDLSLDNLGDINGQLNELFLNDNLVFQLATGLKDKTGHDIYEGDILQSKEKGMCYDWSGQVYFIGGQFICDKCLSNKIWGADGASAIFFHKAIIIGNIFQNPELLK